MNIYQTTSYQLQEAELVLAFSPISSKLSRFVTNSEKKDIKRYVIYKAQIKIRAVQDTYLFEIKMEKTEGRGVLDLLSLEKRMTNDNALTRFETNENKQVYSSGGEGQGQTQQTHEFSAFVMGGYESPDALCAKSMKKKRERLEFVTKYSPSLETGGETSTHKMLISTSPVSERKNLISFAKGDVDDNFEHYSNGRDVSQFDNSTPFSKERRDEETQTAAGLKRTQTNIDRETFVKGDSEKESTVSLGKVQGIDAYKTIRNIVESKRHQNSTLTIKGCFILSICALIIFLIWLNFNTSSTSAIVGNLSQVVQNSYFRSFWAKIAINDMMFWVSVRGTWLEFYPEILQTVFLQDFYRLNGFNQNLRLYLGRLDYDLQEAFYEKEVDVYERDTQNNIRLISVDDTFGVIKKIVNCGIKTGNKPNEFLPDDDFLDYETKFIFDNSLNSFMIVSERLTANMEAIQIKTLNDSKQLMLVGFSVTLAILILFVFASLIFVIALNKHSNNFMSILSTLPSYQIAKTTYSLSTFIDLLEKDSPFTDLPNAFNLSTGMPKAINTSNSDKSEAAKTNKKIVQSTSMKNFNTRNYLVFVGLFACLGLVAGFMIIYYQIALNKMQVMERQHTNLNSALNVLNTFAYIVPGFEVMTMTNASATIKNIPIMTFMKDSVSKVSRVSDFQETLGDTKGDFSTYQKEILFNYSCTEAYSPLWSWPLEVMQPECEQISDGLNFVGLFKLINQLEMKIHNFIEAFENQPRDIQGLKDRFLDVLGISNTTDISFILLLKLFEDSSQNFHDLVIELEDERMTLAWIASFVSVVLGTITWVFIVRKLSRKEFEIKKLLALVPNRLILENYLLKKYISILN